MQLVLGTTVKRHIIDLIRSSKPVEFMYTQAQGEMVYLGFKVLPVGCSVYKGYFQNFLTAFVRSRSLCASSSLSTPACPSPINTPLIFSFYLLFLTNLVNSTFHFLHITSGSSSPALLSNFPAIQCTHEVLLHQNAKYLHRKERRKFFS